MIIDFMNINGGGGSGTQGPQGPQGPQGATGAQGPQGPQGASGITPTLDIATTASTGVVKIGEGISVDSAGTISVSGGTGGGIEIVSELPASGTDGQMVLLQNFTDEIISYGYVEVNGQVKTSDFRLNGGTVHIIKGNTLPSENLTVVGIEYWGDNYIVLTSAGTFILDGGILDYSSIVIPESGWTRQDGDYYFNVTPTSNGLDLTFTTERDVDVYYSVYIPPIVCDYKMYIWSDSGMTSLDIDLSHEEKVAEFYFDEIPSFTGSAFTLCYSVDNYDNIIRYFKYTSGGTFIYGPIGDNNDWITLSADGKWHWGFDGKDDKYIISDGYIMFNSTGEGQKIKRESLWNGNLTKTGWVKYGYRGIVEKTSCYNDFRFSASQEGWKYYNDSIGIWGVPYPSKGKYLYSPGDEYMQWVEIPETKNVEFEVPKYAEEGKLIVVPSTDIVGSAATTAFIAQNSTSIDNKNNYNVNSEINHTDWGNNYFYYNKGNYTSTGDTLLYIIQMRSNDNGDWGTSDLKELYVYQKYDSANTAYYFEVEWNFSYNNVTYNSAITITSGQSVDTDYFPVWKYWDDGYGYKFNFSSQSGNDLTWYMRHSGIDIESSYSGYTEGENYGEVSVRMPYYTKNFTNSNVVETTASLYTMVSGRMVNLGSTVTGQTPTPTPEPTGETGTLSINVDNEVTMHSTIEYDEMGVDYTITLSGASSGVTGIVYLALGKSDYDSASEEYQNQDPGALDPDTIGYVEANGTYVTGNTVADFLRTGTGDFENYGEDIYYKFIKAYGVDSNNNIIQSISASTNEIHIEYSSGGDEPEEEPEGE